MDRDYRRRLIEILESIANGVAPLSATDGHQHAVDIALKEPWRRITRMAPRENDDHHSDVAALLKFLKAVQQHRLAADPAELLELLSLSPCARARGNDYDANIGSIHGNSFANRSLTVRTPAGLIPLGSRDGTARSDMYAVVIPIFAASARRRSD